MLPAITPRLLAVALIGAAVGACSSAPGPREVAGTLVSPTPAPGAAMANPPDVAASPRMGGAVSGGAIGGMIGPRIGAALDDEDKRRAYAAQVQALEGGPSGAPVAWRNPDSGRYGSIVPGPAYQANGANCRQFTHTIYIDAKPQTARGAACRNADGTWVAG